MAEPTIKINRGKWRDFFRRLWHRPLWFFVRLGIIALALATVLLVLFYHIFRDEIEMVLTRWVENQTHYLFRPEVTFSSMAMPQLGEFIFEDFRVADPFGRPEEVISTERVRVEFDPLKILSRGINLALVEIQGGNFHVHRDSTGETNLFKIFKSIGGKGENGTRIRVRSFILDNCRVRLEDLDDQPIDNEIERMEGSFTSISGEHVVEVHHGGVTTTYWSVGRAEISGIFPIKSGSLGFRGVRVLKGETDLTGSGFVDFHNRTYEYKITDGRCETAHLPPELKIADRFSGTVGVSVTFSGSFDSTAVQAGLTLDSGVIFDFPVSGLSTLLKYDSGSLSFERIETRACGGTLEGEMHFDVAGSDDSYQIRAHVRDARIEEIGIPNLEKLEGTLSARLDLRARGYSKHDFEIEGTGEMIEGNLGGMRIDSAGVNFSYREGKVRVEDLTLHCWESITTAIGDMENDELFLFLNIENLPARRLGRLLPVTDLSGAIDFSGSLTGRLFDPKLKGSLSISSGAFRNLRFHLLEGTCELEHLADTVQGNLQIDLHGVDFAGQALEKLHLNTEIPHRGLNRFSPLILMQDSLNMLYCNGFYTINPQTGEQEIAVDSLELLYRGVRATGREIMEIQRRGDTTRVTSLSLSTMGGTISGDLELAGTDFFRAGVRSALIFKEIDFSRLAFLLGTDQEAGGRLNGTLDVSGTLASPVCSLE
ncbi:MAG: hypothetical protein U9P14_10670, partial [Gemmatimonadota bacterium]|nr:hypothetical protein [Gemmatimonadota bacterium]